MKKKVRMILSIIVIIIAIFMVLYYVIGQKDDEDTQDNTSGLYLDAKILEIQEEYLMVEALEDQTIAGEVQIWIGLLKDKDVPKLKVGDVARIPHDGKMTMSLPPQMSAVGRIEILK